MIKRYIAIMLAGLMLASTVVGCKKNNKPVDNESVSTTMEDIKDTSAVDETEEDDTSEITGETTAEGVENETTTEDMEEETSATETEESTITDEITETNVEIRPSVESSSEEQTDSSVIKPTVEPSNPVIKPTEEPAEPTMESTSEYSQDSEIEKEAMTIANNIISDIIDDSMTDFEKTMGIILWMLGNIEYESGWAIRDYDVKTAIETLKSRNAQYIGYMSAFYLLANAADLQVKYILGVKDPNAQCGEGHLWIQIKLDNSWYNIDILTLAEWLKEEERILNKLQNLIILAFTSDDNGYYDYDKYFNEYKEGCSKNYSKRDICEYFVGINGKNTVYGETYTEVASEIQKMASKGIKDVEVWLRKDDSEIITVLNVKDPAKFVYGETYAEVASEIQKMATKGVKDIEVWFTPENSGMDRIYQIENPRGFVFGRTCAEVLTEIQKAVSRGEKTICAWYIKNGNFISYSFEINNPENLVYGESCKEILLEIQKRMVNDEVDFEIIILNDSGEMIDYNKEISYELAELSYVMNGRTSTYSTGMYYADILVKKTGVDVSNWYFVNSKDELLELCESNYQNGQSTTIVKTKGFEGEWIDALMNKIYGSVESYDVSEYVIYIININGIK